MSKPLTFEAIKNKFVTDEDGEATLILKVNMQEQVSAFAVPAKKRLKISVEVLDD
ncbi:MAG: hypothetical protein ABFC84_16745 [Veillonellales bacterium]